MDPRELIKEEFLTWREPKWEIRNRVAVQVPGLDRVVRCYRFFYRDGTLETCVTREPVKV